MKGTKSVIMAAGMLAAVSVACSWAVAQPVLNALGSAPSGLSNPTAGTYYISGNNARWSLSGGALTFAVTGASGGGLISSDGAYQTCTMANGGQVTGNTVATVSPAFSIPTSFTTATLPAANLLAARYTAAGGSVAGLPGFPNDAYTQGYACFGSGDSGQVHNAQAMSQNGRFIVVQGYISTYNSAGTAIAATSTFRFRGGIWDASTNTMRLLPTPMRTTSPTTRRRDGTAFDVSNDGVVVVGAQDHNSGTTPASTDPDGGRPAVWRWNGADYVMSYLPNGVNASGFPITYSMSVGSFHINAAGTVIVGPAVSDAGAAYIAKWVWNAGTSTWDAPVSLGSNLSAQATWLPASVTTCPINQPTAQPTLFATGMSDDGSTVVGFATYSTCGSFMRAGWIWTASSGVMQDWYDYLNAQGVAGLAPGAATTWGPIGDGSPVDYTKGLPKLGNPSGISPDGSAIIGSQGGNQVIIGAPSWILLPAGSPCIAPQIAASSTASVNFSKCARFVNLTIQARGTTPTFQWYRGATALVDGVVNGTSTTGSQTPALSIVDPMPADAGSYHCLVTNACGSAQSADSVVQLDAAAVTPNDTCATATPVGEGTFTFNICGGFTTDGTAFCAASPEAADLWYVYTPTFTGEARFQTCGSSFDSTLELLDGCNGTVLACNDNVGTRGLVGTTCSSSRSLISRFAVTAGVPVTVRVGAISTSATGALTISQAPPAPANDLCENATPVGLGTFAFNLSEATDDYAFGTDFCSTAGSATSTRDVWFLLNAPCGATVTVDTCGSTITNPMLHIMSGCAGTVLACNDNVGTAPGCTSNQARITGFTTATSVLIRVSSSGSSAPSSGVGQINISGTITPCCGSADFNCDSDVGTDADIESFFACLSGSCPPAPCTSSADFNGDGDVGTDADIEAFFRVLSGGTC